MPSAFEHGPSITIPASPAANSVAAWSAANNLGATIAMNAANLSGAIADDDIVLIYDTSTSSLKTVAKSVFVAGIGGTAVAGTTDNGLLTFVNSGSTFAAEANLTFDGTNLTVATGNVIIGTAGKGIDFSVNTQSAVSGAALVTGGELLDWYEEGTWTPIVQDHSGGIMSQQTNGPNNNGGKVGKYTRIGNVVYIQCRIICNGNGTANTAQTVTIHGLPFTHQNMFNLQAHMAVGFGASWGITAGVGPGNWIEPGNDFINMAMFDDAAGTTNMFIAGDLSHDGQIGLTGHYFV